MKVEYIIIEIITNLANFISLYIQSDPINLKNKIEKKVQRTKK